MAMPNTYYETRFRTDLQRYCGKRSDAYYTGDSGFNAMRRIRLGTGEWETQDELDFLFCLYFTVLTDMAIHSHFPECHATFDRKTLYPKLYGIGVKQRLLPSAVLSSVRFREGEYSDVVRKWLGYCDGFIADWRGSLPYVCGINGDDFLNALLGDDDLRQSLELAIDGGRLNRAEEFESIMLDRIKGSLQFHSE